MKVIVTCPCGKDFASTQKRLDEGRGRFCSKPKKCHRAHDRDARGAATAIFGKKAVQEG